MHTSLPWSSFWCPGELQEPQRRPKDTWSHPLGRRKELSHSSESSQPTIQNLWINEGILTLLAFRANGSKWTLFLQSRAFGQLGKTGRRCFFPFPPFFFSSLFSSFFSFFPSFFPFFPFFSLQLLPALLWNLTEPSRFAFPNFRGLEKTQAGFVFPNPPELLQMCKEEAPKLVNPTQGAGAALGRTNLPANKIEWLSH